MAATKTEEKAENKNVIVTFKKPWGRYSRGDVAGFPQEQATKLTDGIKVAVTGAVSDEKLEEKVAE